MSTTTNLDKLKINYLTQEQYEDAVENEEINENELYFTPGHNNDAIVPVELTQAEYDALTAEQKNNGMVYCVSDANGTYLTASEVSYGSSSVQDALDDLSGNDYYKDGEEISLCGTWVALSGQSTPIRAGFTIPGKKKIPSNASITLSNDFHVNWLRGDNVTLTPEYHTSYIVGDSVLVELKATDMGALSFFATHIDSGNAIIHL